MIHRQFPGCLDTPWGRAELIPGSTLGGRMPAYELIDDAHMIIPLDTRIPPDLEARWYWLPPLGLSDGAVCIAAVTFPPPLCYEQARAHERGMERLEGAARGLVVQLTLF